MTPPLLRRETNVALLAAVPVTVYLLSYCYLAVYHEAWFLWFTIVHESGKYTLLENMFYASHFLGHIPIITIMALWQVGWWEVMSAGNSTLMPRGSSRWLLWGMAGLLVFSAAVALLVFGWDDTSNYLLQNKQSERTAGEGGSWNLHLPSTMALFLLMPVWVAAVRWLAAGSLGLRRSGLDLVAGGVVAVAAMTWLVNSSVLAALLQVWTDPRYLAHSVREIATFPVTYYPWGAALLLAFEQRQSDTEPQLSAPWLRKVLLGVAVLFAALLAYQVVVSLFAGVGDLAQKPSFAKGGKLGVPYLLASHYFEHFLDTLYFTLVVGLLAAWRGQPR